MEVLTDYLRDICNDMECITEYFLKEPYDYPQDVIDEMIDILDRIELLHLKLMNLDFKGSFRYE